MEQEGGLMAEISMKFNPEFIPLILNGKKIVTTRLKQKGLPGDKFTVDDQKFCIKGVGILKLYLVLKQYRSEGFSSATAFYETLKRIYPEIDLDSVVYVHYFCSDRDEVA